MCGWMMAKFGQRRAILLVTPLALASWVAVWASTSAWLLLSARVVSGFCIGVGGTSTQMYIIETSHPSVRGALTGIADLLVGFGVLLVFSLGAAGLGWRWSAFIVGFVTCIPLLVGLLFFPDSPRWLVTVGKVDKAVRALLFFRGQAFNVDQELAQIKEAKAKTDGQDQSFVGKLTLLKMPLVRVPFATVCGVYALNQLSGNYVIYSYTVTIFEIARADVSPFVSAVFVGLARIAGSLIGMVVVEKGGRRPAMMAGGVGVALTFSSLATYFMVKESSPETADSLWWLPVTVLFLYTVIFAASTSPLPFLLAGELLPLSFRAIGSALGKGVFFLVNLFVTLTFPALVKAVGAGVVFFFYAFMALLLVVFVYFRVPETKGKSLEHIEQWFAKH